MVELHVPVEKWGGGDEGASEAVVGLQRPVPLGSCRESVAGSVTDRGMELVDYRQHCLLFSVQAATTCSYTTKS